MTRGEACAIGVAALPLIWPALWNGYPLVFSDTGTYLSQAIAHYAGWDRPVFYSLFLLPLHLTLTTWPVVVAQAVLTAHTLRLTARAVLPFAAAWWLPVLTIGLALATALPWFASQLMPDLFTGLLVLALGLLAFVPAAVSGGERAWLVCFAGFMIAAHQSHLLLAAALLPVAMAVAAWQGRLSRRDGARLLAAPLLAACAMVSVNLLAHHRVSLSPYGNVFLLARVIYDGPGRDVLARDCPRAQWRLCPYRDALPATADLFMWTADGPLARAGGAKRVSADADAIIWTAVHDEPGTELRAILSHGADQMAMFATGDGLTPWPDTVTPWIARDFPPAEGARYGAAAQTRGRLVVPDWLRRLHVATALAGVALCGLALPIAFARRHPVAGILLIVLLALPLNALITGGLSGPHDRYQSRIMWLPVAVAALAVPALARRSG